MRITQRHEQAAANLVKGMPIYKALTEAGFSENSAKRGKAALTKPIMRALRKHGRKYIELGRISAEEQELMVRGRLVYNTIQGEDSGVQSAKTLGSDRRVNMFTPENMIGIQIINAPKELSVSAAISKEEE